MYVTFTIQIRPVGDTERAREVYERLDLWRRLCRNMGNQVLLHRLLQGHVADMVYLNEGIKAKLNADEEDGLLNTSLQNATYRILKDNDLPSDIINCVNSRACKDYRTAAANVAKGVQRIPFYKNNVPIPFSSASISFYTEKDKRRLYCFRLFKMDFVCVLGKDHAGYAYRLDKIVDGEADYGNPSLYFDKQKRKWFLLLPIPIDVSRPDVDASRTCYATLGVETPITARFDQTEVYIGSWEDFGYRRKRISDSLRRLQVAVRFSKGGKGRAQKLSALNRFHESERRFTHDQLHKYSRALIAHCLRRGFGSLVLKIEQEVNDESKRFWSVAELRDMIMYKGNAAGVRVVCP